ncbi:hypothetical protein AMK68_00880 [candidate division KD3-62 bacterium DG_56]|uniref:Large ribosomal subunit protein uL4 n=1 Tax=candidate division KD3-62 bacterium DG_56 TaxID=1704032 RepID=A0A0S7XRL8_9BACT|nr:MAG: hypothetical protein AMK68_00880 [candidate division KD3-62 bacterium DG_56]
MPSLPLYNATGDAIGEIEVSPVWFDAPANEALVHQVVVGHLANRRARTASTKTRAEVRGSGRKPWRQKGTGRARVGDRRNPLWRHGGIIHGPRPGQRRHRTPRKMRRAALRCALTSKREAGEALVVDGISAQEPRTRDMAALMDHLDLTGKTLWVLGEQDQALEWSLRNLPGVSMALPNELNAYSVLSAARLVFTRAALERLEALPT